MTAATSFLRAAPVALLAAVLLVTGCAEREVILPGEREDIRDGTVEAAGENQSRPIRLATQSSNKDWTHSIGTQAYRTAHPALRATPVLAWSAEIGAGDSRKQRITAEPVVVGGLIYTLDASARVTATTSAGLTAWTTDLTPVMDSDGDATGGGMAYAKGRIYVSLGFGKLVALDAASGGMIWTQQLEATGSGQPTVVDGIIYVVAGDDTGWAVNTDDGRIAWQITGTSSVANVLGAPAPALTSKLAIFAFGSGDLVATFRRGGLRRWDASVSGQRTGRASSRISDVTGAPVVVGNRVFAGNHSGRLVALDVESGDRLWTAREGPLGPVWPAGDSLFLVTDRLQLARIDASDGEVIWAVDLPGFVKDTPRRRSAVFAHYGPVVAGGRVIVASNDGFLRSFAPEDGRLVHQTEVPGGATTSPVVAGNTLYVVGSKGQLFAFR